ncbi:MAG: hypothetical protein GC159_13620 [Phycisphaera sp.]|nr:hypothetical protein [Phycisphaera sp.]
MSRRRSRGSLLLLVVASLLFLLLLGLTYMEVAKQDRIATRNLYIRRDLDLQLREIRDVIASRLKQDLGIDDNSTPGTLTDDRFFDKNNGDGQESYDYPGPVDKWLAETIPSSGTTFAQITLLGANYSAGGTTQTGVNAQDVSAVNGQAITSEPRADADGDQLLDSKFEDAPIPMLHGVRYYMAVRIIDNSSLVNLNTALALSNGGTFGTTVNNAPRWWYPSEINAANMINGFTSGSYGNRNAEFAKLQAYRTGSATVPLPWGGAISQRADYWLNGPAVYGNTVLQSAGGRAYKLIADSEIELRHRFALKNSMIRSTLEERMTTTGDNTVQSQFLRSDTTTPEIQWKDAPDVGGSTTNYFDRNPRLYFTTISGSSILAPTKNGESSTIVGGAVRPISATLKRDINKLADEEADGNPATKPMGVAYNQILGTGTLTANTTTATITGASAKAQAMADMLAVNTVDYRDADSKVTRVSVTTDGGPVTMYGLEALPYIAETYAQRHYTYDTTGNNWVAGPGETAGYVIEIRNPHRKPVDLSTVYLKFGPAPPAGTLQALSGQATLAPDEALILYRDSTGGGNDGVSTRVTAAGTTNPATVVAIAENWPNLPAPHAPFEIMLEVEDDSGALVPYQKTLGLSMPDLGGPGDATNPPTTTSAYWQGGYIGNGNGINVMTFRGTLGTSDMHAYQNSPPPDGATGYTYDAGSDALGDSSKTAAGGPADKVDLTVLSDPNRQIAFNDSGYISHVGELALVTTLTWQNADGHRIADQWAAGTNFYLDFANTANMVDTTQQHLAVPHAVMLIDRFTTLSPYEDGVDNDTPNTDGVDGADTDGQEFFVPGTLNINTMPNKAWNALPIANSTTRNTIRDAIKAYRDDPTKRPTNHRVSGGSSAKGISMIGELMNIFNTNNGAYSDPIGNDGADTYQFGTTPIDFLSNPTTAGADGIKDDREERSMMLRWLGQVCTTRSDVFTAYVLLRGYRDQPPTQAFVERRAFIIFDRSSVEDNSGRVRILGLYIY